MSKFIFGLNFALTVAIAEGNPEIYGYQTAANQPDACGLPKEEQ